MSDLLNILQSKEVPIENQQILDYLQGQLQAGAQHSLEENEQNDPMMQDALEGLRMMPDTAGIEKVTAAINMQLQQRIASQKLKRKDASPWKDQNWQMMIAVIILLLIIISIIAIWRLRASH